MKAKLTVNSYGNGWKDCVRDDEAQLSADGEVAVIRYKINGDACTLVADGRRAVQKREGEFNTIITFNADGEGECTFSSGELQGGYAVQTTHYKFVNGKTGCMLNMTYLSGEDKEEINLKVKCLYKR